MESVELISSGFSGGLRVLGRVRMLRAGIDFQFCVDRASEAVVGDHPAHRALDEKFRTPFASGLECLRVVSTDVAGEAGVDLGYIFFATHGHLRGVEDDDEIAGVHMRSKNGLVFPTEEIGGFLGHTPEGLAGGVDNPPGAFDLPGFCGISFHRIVNRNRGDWRIGGTLSNRQARNFCERRNLAG